MFDNLITQDHSLFVYGLVALGVLLVVDGFYYLFIKSGGAKAKVNRRLEMLDSGMDSKEVLAKLRKDRKDSPSWFGLFNSFVSVDRLGLMIYQSGLKVTLTHVILYMVILFVGLFFIFRIFMLVPIPFALLLASMVGIGLPLLYIYRKRIKRFRKFEEQLPEAIDLLTRSLRSGHPLSASFGIVAQQMKDPIGTEFGIAVDEMTYGVNLKEAVLSMTKRIPVQDLQYLNVAIQIQYGVGGNLAEVLDGLSKVIRGRFQMFRKARAITAEGRMTALILTFLPLGFAAGMFAINPDFYLRTADHPLFTILSIVAGILCVMNALVMRWITNLKI